MAGERGMDATLPRGRMIVVCGPTCTGKTTLGAHLATDLRLPFFAKDAIKERLYDTLGWSDRAWSRQLGAATMAVLYVMLDAEMAAGRSFIVESNFHAALAVPELGGRMRHWGYRAFTMQCVCDGPTLLARWRERTFNPASGRHPGHVERTMEEECAPGLLRGRDEPLLLEGTRVEVDTTDFVQVEAAYPVLLARVHSFLASGSDLAAAEPGGAPDAASVRIET